MITAEMYDTLSKALAVWFKFMENNRDKMSREEFEDVRREYRTAIEWLVSQEVDIQEPT